MRRRKTSWPHSTLSIYIAAGIYLWPRGRFPGMAENLKLSIAEVRKTVVTSLTAAFGFVIALMWNTVVQSGFATAGIPLGTTAKEGNWGGWAYFVVSALVITVVMVIFIVVLSRAAAKEPPKT